MFFDVDAVSDHSNPLPHMFPNAEQFGRDVGALGICNDDTVVLYDSGGWVAAPRVWWMFLSFGHQNVRMLNGGLKKWRAEGRKVESGQVTPKPATFKATFDPSYTRSIQQMVANLASRAEQVLDARANERYQGKVAEPRPGLRSGHIPGSLSVPYNQLVRCRDRRDEAARRIARGVSRRRRQARRADRDELRLRRLRAGVDAGALSSRRARQRAL